MVACSGGADSAALVLALATATRDLVVAHVVHDLRPPDEAEADRAAVERLAARLGLEYAESRIRVRGATKGVPVPTNIEARARRLRYAALGKLAALRGCPFVATAHHAGDQLETMLMALIRGGGARGLSGIAVRRRLVISRGTGREPGASVWLVRPMLGGLSGRVGATTRSEAESICRAADLTWQVDATNADVSLLRNALRRDVLPALDRLRPGAAVRAARTAAVLAEAAAVVDDRVEALWASRSVDHGGSRSMGSNGANWPRAVLRSEPVAVVGALLRRVALEAGDGSVGGDDRLGRRALAAAVHAVRDDSDEPRELRVGRLRLRVRSRQVEAWAEPVPRGDR